MALVKCRECGSEVSDSAKTCPKCGVSSPADIHKVSKQPSLKCRECGKEITTKDWKACPHCGIKSPAVKPKTVKCTKCGGEVEQYAKVCPACGEKNHNGGINKKMAMIWVLVVIGVVVYIVNRTPSPPKELTPEKVVNDSSSTGSMNTGQPVISPAQTVNSQIVQTSANDNADLMKFARANGSKFKSEIVAVGKASVGARVIVSFRDFVGPSGATYDENKGEMVIPEFSSLGMIKFEQECTPAGTYEGQNAFGAKAKITNELCDIFYVDHLDFRGKSLSHKRIKMSPSQYREIINNGVQAEIDFSIRQPSKGYVVKYGEGEKEATISDPTHSNNKVWTINGIIDGVRYFLPGSKDPVTVIKAPSEVVKVK
ncbi:MAG: zinc ribbon domain-containing protein [Nitrosomonadales bacterium]|nr:zinc ribbon domain-containing protein [Nitrosomonadales bacterium]